MVIFDVDNMMAGKSEAPTAKTIEAQRQKQLDAVIRIRRLLEKVTSLAEGRAA